MKDCSALSATMRTLSFAAVAAAFAGCADLDRHYIANTEEYEMSEESCEIKPGSADKVNDMNMMLLRQLSPIGMVEFIEEDGEGYWIRKMQDYGDKIGATCVLWYSQKDDTVYGQRPFGGVVRHEFRKLTAVYYGRQAKLDAESNKRFLERLTAAENAPKK